MGGFLLLGLAMAALVIVMVVFQERWNGRSVSSWNVGVFRGLRRF